MPDYEYGSEPYFLDRLDSTLEKLLEEIQELHKLERVTIAYNKAQRDQEKWEREFEQAMFMLSDFIAFAMKDTLVKKFIQAIEATPLSSLSKALSSVQDVIHDEVTKREKAAQALKQNAENAENVVVVGLAPANG